MTTDSNFVDPDTDDLDAFNDLLSGVAKPTPAEVADEDQEIEAETSEEIDETIEDNEDPLATEDKDTSDEDAEETEDDDLKLSGKRKGKKTFQERINELTRQAREAERERDAIRLEMLELRTAKTEIKTETSVTDNQVKEPHPDDVGADGKPVYPLGEFDPKFISAITQHTFKIERERMLQEEKAQREENEKTQARQALATEWEGKLEEAETRYEDLRPRAAMLENTFSSLDPAYGEYLATTIMSLDKGADVLYYLSSNLNEAKKIVNLGPTLATVALGRLEAQFYEEPEVEKTAPVIKTSKAPIPPAVLNRGTSAKLTIPDDTDDLDAFERKFYQKKR